MNSEILLSVIVPAYNVAEWLPRCLDSILLQTYKNLEVLVIDDGSSDETPQIADRYAARDARIRAIHQQNRGLVETRERGIREAKGEYVGFVDGDDEIVPEMYERLLNNALSHHAQISQCGILYCFYDGRRKPVRGTGKLMEYERTEGCAALLRGSEMEPSLCNKIFHSSILADSCLDPSVINNEDMLRNIVLFDRAERSVMEDFCGYLYWRRNDSMSNNRKAAENGRNILRARELIREYVPQALKEEAQNNCTYGAISVFNSLICNDSAEAINVREQCRRTLREGLKKGKGLPSKTRAKAFAIIYFPVVYKAAERVHIRQRNKNIRKQAEQARAASLPREGGAWNL